MNKSTLLGGFPIAFASPLKKIYQPKLKDIYSLGFTITGMITPFSLIVQNKDFFEKSERALYLFISYCEKLKETNNMQIYEEFIVSLKILYRVDFDNIKLKRTTNSIMIEIVNYEGETLGIISDDNLIELSETVLKILDFAISKSKNKTVGDKELVDKLEKRRREYQEKKKKELEGKGISQTENAETVFHDMINYIVHQQQYIDYDKVFDLTVWQLKNTYSILTAKEHSDRFVNSGSVHWKAEDYKDWMGEIRFNKK